MFKLSRRSRARLDTCHPSLVRVVEAVYPHYDLTVLEGRRTWDRQRELQEQGKSQVPPGVGLHTAPDETQDYLSHAVDIAPWPIDWHDRNRFCFLAGQMLGAARELRIRLRWGGDWDRDGVILTDQSFDDLPHFELDGYDR